MRMEVPISFRNQMEEQLGTDAPLFFESLLEPSLVSIRLNASKGMVAPENSSIIPWCSSGYTLLARPAFTLDPLFHGGAYYVQEASSMFLEQAVGAAMDVSKPLVALDLCAAPGGKSTHLLSLLNPESLVVSNEVIKARANILTENITKWGAPNSVVTNNDPQSFSNLSGTFDLVLVDAPCSGEGLFRKDSNAIAEWSPDNVALCSLRQRRVLADVWPALKEGGVLIYSTCTFNKIENEENLKWLAENKAVEFISIPLKPEWGIEEVNQNGVVGYRFYPHKVKGEGFFISVIRKLDNVGRDWSKNETILKILKDSTPFQPWIKNPNQYDFFERPEGIRILPKGHLATLGRLAKHLFILEAGTLLGAWKHQKFIPSHALAVSQALHSMADSFELNETQALQFLRKETFQQNAPKGHRVVKYKGVGLGWVNGLGNRLNNMYPTQWRIRM